MSEIPIKDPPKKQEIAPAGRHNRSTNGKSGVETSKPSSVAQNTFFFILFFFCKSNYRCKSRLASARYKEWKTFIYFLFEFWASAICPAKSTISPILCFGMQQKYMQKNRILASIQADTIYWWKTKQNDARGVRQ